MDNPVFVQIATGEYTYLKEGNQEVSHAIYGLDENGQVYKYIPMKRVWVLLEDLEFN